MYVETVFVISKVTPFRHCNYNAIGARIEFYIRVQVLRSVGRMQDLCQQLPQTAGLPRAKASTDKSNGLVCSFFTVLLKQQFMSTDE